MTIRQISEAAGCHIDTTRKVARAMYQTIKAPSRGMAIDYDEEQSFKIMERLPKRNMVDTMKNNTLPLEKSSTSESSLTQKDLEMIGVIVGHVMKNMESRVSNIEQKFEERKALLPPPEMEPRQHVNKIINNYCHRSGSAHREARHDLYREFGYIYHKNVFKASENRSISVIDYIDESGMMDNLLSLALKMFAEGQLI